jgi:hypothetical protein
MRARPNPADSRQDPSPIEAFGRDLADAYRPPGEVPGDVDRRLAGMARARFASPPFVAARRRRLLLRVVATAAVGAAAAVVALLVWTGPSGLPGHPRPPAGGAPDIVISVEPTILDAFALARQLEAGVDAGRQWDANADGLVDRRDVDAIARRAVQLERGPI